MDAPKCRNCGKVEWKHVCGGLNEATKAGLGIRRGVPKGRPEKARSLEAERQQAVLGGGSEGLRKDAKQRWPRDLYNAYQREYMRAYRAKKKA